MDQVLKCKRCNKAPRRSAHANAKFCEPCRQQLTLRPVGRLTPAQIRHAKSLIHKMPRDEIAKKVGVSTATLRRWARDNGNISLAYFNRWASNPKLVRRICEYYAKHGRPKTEKKFPTVRVRSVVERYFKLLGLPERQSRWTPAQLIELARMAGLVSKARQARHFNRPRAHVGSITSAWMKKYRSSGSSVNGLSFHLARRYVRASCPLITTEYWSQRPDSKRGVQYSRQLALWVDVERYLRADVPPHLVDAIKALAKFQRWLHGRNVRANVKRLIRETGK